MVGMRVGETTTFYCRSPGRRPAQVSRLRSTQPALAQLKRHQQRHAHGHRQRREWQGQGLESGACSSGSSAGTRSSSESSSRPPRAIPRPGMHCAVTDDAGASAGRSPTRPTSRSRTCPHRTRRNATRPAHRPSGCRAESLLQASRRPRRKSGHRPRRGTCSCRFPFLSMGPSGHSFRMWESETPSRLQVFDGINVCWSQARPGCPCRGGPDHQHAWSRSASPAP